MIHIENLSKTYPGKKIAAVKNISLQVKKGDVFGFLGPNGAGKTTTVKILVGLLRPTQGKIKIFDSDPDDFTVKQKIGFLPEHPYFYQYLTAREFLQMCTRIFRLPQSETEKKTEEALQQVRLRPDAWDQKIKGYSKGMQQRLGLAQALINDPELIILDEPTSGLDPLGRKEVKDLILELKQRGKTIFFSSHILADVEDLCNRIVIIDHGEIVLEGTVPEVTKKKTISLEQVFVDALTAARS